MSGTNHYDHGRCPKSRFVGHRTIIGSRTPTGTVLVHQRTPVDQ